MDVVLMTVGALVAVGLAVLGVALAAAAGPFRRFAGALHGLQAGLRRGTAPLRAGVRRRRTAPGA